MASEWHYTVQFGGVGEPPHDLSHVGHCSQYAVFTRHQQQQQQQTCGADSDDNVCDGGETSSSSASLVYEQVRFHHHLWICCAPITVWI